MFVFNCMFLHVSSLKQSPALFSNLLLWPEFFPYQVAERVGEMRSAAIFLLVDVPGVLLKDNLFEVQYQSFALRRNKQSGISCRGFKLRVDQQDAFRHRGIRAVNSQAYSRTEDGSKF